MMLVFAWLTFFYPRLHLSDAIVTSYYVLLSVYITHKEVSRWVGVPINVKSGELMVLLWWVSLFTMMAISFFTNQETPFEVRQIAYDVLAAFLISAISKNINVYRKSKNKNEPPVATPVLGRRVSKKNLKTQKERLSI